MGCLLSFMMLKRKIYIAYMIRIAPYIVWGLAFWLTSWYEYSILWVLLLIFLKDLLVSLSRDTEKEYQVLDHRKLSQAYKGKEISDMYYLSVINRAYFFPVLLTVYLIYVLIQQTMIRDLHLSIWYMAISENVLLGITVVSGIFLGYKQESDKMYKVAKKHSIYPYMYMWLVVLMSLVSYHIIFQQTTELGKVGMIVAILSWALVATVGVLLLEEEDEEEEPGV